jgi:hypothetical protein
MLSGNKHVNRGSKGNSDIQDKYANHGNHVSQGKHDNHGHNFIQGHYDNHVVTSWRIMGNDVIAEDQHPISQVSAPVAMVFLCVGNENVRAWNTLQWHKVHTKFYENPSSHSSYSRLSIIQVGWEIYFPGQSKPRIIRKN